MTRKHIKTAGIVVKSGHEEAFSTAGELAAWLKDHSIEVTEEPVCPSEVNDDESSPVRSKCAEADLLIVLGGDGTMIATARVFGDGDSLVLGVNYGSLGYLTEFRIEEMYSALELILAGNYKIESRVMISAEHWRGDEMLAKARVLNDVVINKAALARIIEIKVSLNSQFVTTYRADGLIISTPTGSTAYNLSAGGPIVYPSMNAFVITPICPFTLSNRPIVVPDDAEIEITLDNENEGVILTLDGQIGHTMMTGDRAVIRKSSTTFDLIQPPNRNYFDVLRNKLQWGR